MDRIVLSKHHQLDGPGSLSQQRVGDLYQDIAAPGSAQLNNMAQAEEVSRE